ncbi:Thg1p [Sugiyamaella lignohabitans]|uniref:tRNA(His) guanylyltransferase n=1 Tax=Sugiyamaella lignohabitans TaxID=796027 RepID=A0A161HIR7_9ASCO|nr:Thg1p [Sugiyamaella lignohabitans]ANB12457.1 Thg1p [Sugiyamaella lignohabitans]
MNGAAKAVMTALPDIFIAYGDSDEYSFVLDKDCQLFERRESKLVSTVVSTFTAHYISLWDEFFPGRKLELNHLPTFDGRAVVYPSKTIVRDYLAWRQADCHINNLYNTTFWTLVQDGGLTTKEAEEKLKGTLSSDKNEILFSQFGINYNKEPEIFKKGTVIVREYETPNTDGPSPVSTPTPTQPSTPPAPLTQRQLQRRLKKKSKATISTLHTDIIGDDFWNKRPYLLE